MTVPAAMHELVIRYFGEGPNPNYSHTPAILLRNPYRAVREELDKSWSVFDFTSLDSDLGYSWAIEGHSITPTIRLSVVGPYALVTAPGGAVIRPPDLVEILERHGFVLLGRELLEQPFTFYNAAEDHLPLYEFIFEFGEGFPWAR